MSADREQNARKIEEAGMELIRHADCYRDGRLNSIETSLAIHGVMFDLRAVYDEFTEGRDRGRWRYTQGERTV